MSRYCLSRPITVKNGHWRERNYSYHSRYYIGDMRWLRWRHKGLYRLCRGGMKGDERTLPKSIYLWSIFL